MGVEVMGFEPAPAPFQIENGKLDSEPVFSEPIKFGSHEEEEVKIEAKVDVAESAIPTNAVEDWPEPKQIHNFYFIRHRLHEDPMLAEKLDRAKKEFESKRDARSEIYEELKEKRDVKSHVISQLKVLNSEDKEMWGVIDGKRSDIRPLTDALGKLRGSKGGKGYLCSSEEELDSLIRNKNYLIQHESNTLAEERELMNEIKQLEQSRKNVIANVLAREKVEDKYGKKEVIQDQVKFMGDNLDEVKKDHKEVKDKKKKLQDELNVIDKGIEALNKKLDDVTEKKDKAYENLQNLRNQRDEGNAHYYQYRKLLNNARNLASKRDVNALKELSETEVEKFMHLWSSSKGFRDDYEKKNLVSLDNRLLSRDGRTRNPDEKPIIQAPPTKPPVETASAGSQTNAKQPNADSKPGLQNGSLATGKIKEEALKKPEESFKKPAESPIEEEDEFFLQVKVSTNEKEIDETTLKKMKIQEQKEKHEQALKRKNKLAERKQRAITLSEQGATEKKLTKSEKKGKKKGTTSEHDVDSKESTEPVSEVVESEETTVQTPEALVPSKKNNTVRNRNLSKAPKSIPKAILRRKKATNYWMWAGAAGIVGLILLALVYQFLL